LLGKQYSARLEPDTDTLNQIREKYGDDFEEWFTAQFGYGFDGLTQSEANYLATVRVPDVDALRDRILAARQEGRDKAIAGTLPGRQGEGRQTLNQKPASSGFSVSGVEEAIAPVLLTWHPGHSQRIKLIQSENDLPDRLRGELDASRGGRNVSAKGVFDPVTGNSYLIAGDIHSKEDALRVLAHEGVGHMAMEEMLGEEFQSILNQVQLMKSAGNKKVNKIAQEVHVRYRSENKNTQSKEIIAVMAEKGISNSLMKRVIAAVRKFLRKLGFRLQFSVTELEALIANAERYLRNNKPKEGVRGQGGNNRANFSIGKETASNYESRIDQLFSGEKPEGFGIKILDSSDVLDMLGYGDKPIHLAEGKVVAGQFNHSLTAEHWKKIPQWLENPVAVFDSETVPGRLVFIAPDTVNGDPIVMIIEPDTELGNVEINLMVNAYDRSGHTAPVRRWTEQGLLRYLDKKRSPAFSGTSGLRLPGVNHLQQGLKGKILTQKDLVKYRENRDSQGDRSLFSLDNKNPDEVPDLQAAELAKFAKGGQPLDRLFRAIFTPWLDDHGVFKPGAKGYQKIKSLIVNGKFGETGAGSFMNPILEHARAGLIDRYGLDDEFRDREFEASADERKLILHAADLIKQMKDAGISNVAEAKVFQAILTGEKIDEGAWGKLAAPIRKAIDEMGQEAVQLGLISAESYERNKGSYLHRVYLSHETDQNSLGQWVSKKLASRRKQIAGDNLKGRGMDLKVSMDNIVRATPQDWFGRKLVPGQADKRMKGQKFKVFDRLAPRGEGTGTLPGVEKGGTKAKIQERVYWPAELPVPAKYEAWTDRGLWEVRSVNKDKVVLWRDYTKTERESMGEILDARYALAKTYQLMAHNLANGRFFKDIAKNPAWATNEEPPLGSWIGAKSGIRTFAGYQWVKVPDATIPGTGNAKKWGAISGMYVRSEIWRDLNELDRMQTPGFWKKILTQWKLNKTARNPVVHANNIMSNFVFMDMADIRMQDLGRALVAMKDKDEHYQDALKHGAFGAGYAQHELSRDVLDMVIKEIQEQNNISRKGGAESFFESHAMGKIKVLGKLTDIMWDLTRKADRKLIDYYQLEDEIFRMATYMRRRGMGDDVQVAARIARDQFLNYDIRAPWVNAARQSFLPFISYTYRAVPVIAKSIAERPWKLAKYATVAYAMNALGYALSPGDEDEERRSLRDETQGFTWLGTPRMIRMPWRDDHGNPVFLDIRRWIPAGDVFDFDQSKGAIKVPAWMQFGGPLMLAAELALNKQAFTGKEIVNWKTDTAGDATSKVGGWLWRSWMPSAPWIPGGWYWEKIKRAAKGGRDVLGREYDLPMAFMSSVGIKIQGYDVKLGFRYKAQEIESIKNALTFEMRELERDRARKLIQYDDYIQQKEVLIKKIKNLESKAKEIFGK
jgi:hypothetical protein